MLLDILCHPVNIFVLLEIVLELIFCCFSKLPNSGIEVRCIFVNPLAKLDNNWMNIVKH